MYPGRLLLVASAMQDVALDRFDMGAWRCRNRCQFAGCSIGWAIELIPEFRQHGLVLEQQNLCSPWEPHYKNKRGIFAVMEFFDLPREDAECLFMPEWYNPDHVSPFDVAERIRNYVKERSNVPG